MTSPPYSDTARCSSRPGKRGCLEKTPNDATPSRFAQFAMERNRVIDSAIPRRVNGERGGVARGRLREVRQNPFDGPVERSADAVLRALGHGCIASVISTTTHAPFGKLVTPETFRVDASSAPNTFA